MIQYPNRPNKLTAFFSQLYVRLVILILLILLPALFLALFTAAEQNQSLINAAQDQALTLTRLTAANHEQLVTGTERVLVALAQLPEVRQGNTAACNPLFVQLRETYESYTNFFTVDMAGNTVCTGLPEAAPVNVFDRAWFQRALSVDGLSISDYQIGVISGRPVITFSYPILNAAGERKYLLATALNLEWMNTFVMTSELPPEATLTAIDRSGVILYRYPDGDLWIGTAHTNPQLVAEVVTQKTGFRTDVGLDDMVRLYAYVPLDKNASAFIMVGLSQDSVFAQSRSVLLQSLLVLAVVGLATLLLAIYGVNRLLVRPIRSLVDATVRLSAGERTTRVDLALMADTQELTELGHTFNTMSAALERSHEDLETKVAERTRELDQQRNQLQVTLSSIGDAVIATDPQGKIIFINPVAQQMTGWPESDATNQPLTQVFRIVSESTGESVESPFDKVLREGKIVGLANHTLLIARDGTRIPIDDSGAPIFDENRVLAGVILVFRDIAERRQSEQRLNLLFELTAAFSQALTTYQIAEIVVERGLNALGAVMGVVCLLDDDQQTLEIINRHGLSQESFEKYRRTSINLAGPLNDAVRTDSIVWIESYEDYIIRYPHFAESVQKDGSRAIVCLPLKIDDKKIGGFSFSFATDRPRTPAEESFLIAFAQQCAQSLERARLYEAEQIMRTAADQNLQRVNRLQAATAALSEAVTITQVSTCMLEHTTRAMNASSGLLARLIDNQTILDVIDTRGYDADTLKAWMHIPVAQSHAAIAESVATRDMRWVDNIVSLLPHLQPDSVDQMQLWAIVPLASAERVLGLLLLSIPSYRAPDEADKTFLLTLVQQGTQALERAQLYEQAKEVAALQERQRLARDLHDAVSQVLFSSTSIAEVVPRIWERNPQRAFEQLNQVVTLNRAAMAEMRSLLLELRPETILRTSLSHLLEQLLRAVKGRKTMQTELSIEGEEYFLPPEVHVSFYRIAQESINNSVKHSQATSIRAHLNLETARAELVIQDDGRGFDTANFSAGMGMHTMRERALAAEIDLVINSQPGAGTTVRVTWPSLSPDQKRRHSLF